MSKKRRLWKFPLTICGTVLALLVGGGQVFKDVYKDKSPTINLIITLLSPLALFAFEQLMRTTETYREKIVGNIHWAIRYLWNESFRMRFTYELRFPVDKLASVRVPTAESICEALRAVPGGDPEPTFMGDNFIHLRFSRIPFSVVLKWFVQDVDELAGEEEGEKGEAVFVIYMEPETRDFVLRNARTDIEALSVRVQELQQKLVNNLGGIQPSVLAIADAWFGTSLPSSTPIPRSKIDPISGAKYQLFPGRLHIAGDGVATLNAVCRYVRILEPPDIDTPQE
jgi:hypothetical protein